MKDFFFTSVFLIVAYINFIIGVAFNYKSYNFMWQYKNYTKLAKLKKAIDEEVQATSTSAEIVLLFVLLIDILIMVSK